MTRMIQSGLAVQIHTRQVDAWLVAASCSPPYLPSLFRNAVVGRSFDGGATMSQNRGNMAPRGSAGGRRRGSYVPALDGLRGLAIIMVLFVHFIGDCQPESAFERILIKGSNYGLWGVDLFFVLSGYLITGILYD